MTGGKSGSIPGLKPTGGISTRGNRGASSPNHAAARTPEKEGLEKRERSDTQKVLDRLDGIEKRLESKIDDVINSQEFSTSELNEKIAENERERLVQDEQIGALKDTTSGVSVQLKVQGVRLAEVEAKIERIERERRRNTLIIDGVTEKVGEVTATILDNLCKDLQIGVNAGSCTAIF